MKPVAPRKVYNDIDQIAPSVWNQLIDCLEYAMNTPRGDNKTTYRDGDVIHALRSAASAESGESSSGQTIFLCKTTDTATNGLVLCDVFGDGYDNAATATSRYAIPIDMALVDSPEIGKRFIGMLVAVSETGGSES